MALQPVKASERVLTTIEAAAEIGRSPQQISLLIRQGKLTAEKRGRDWFIRAPDLELVRDRPKGRPLGTKDSKPRKAAKAPMKAAVETSGLPVVTAAEMKAGDVVKTPAKLKTKKHASKKES